MPICYFDCFAGISGDMTLGALVDAGLPLEDLKRELSKLNVDGFTISAAKVVKNGITGTKVTVTTEEQKAHRHLRHIREILEAGALSESVKRRSLAVFETLAEAEATIHNTTPEKIHFHEVGALDAIVDVVGAVVGLELLGIERLVVSPIGVGTGYVDCQHGRIPVPAPATLEILKGIPLRATGIEAELTTPTGAAIVRTLADEFGPGPDFTPDRIGYGAGQRDLPIPNLLRIVIGEQKSNDFEIDRVDQVEANIDDMPPERFEFVMERLMEQGALDVLLVPVIMKKSRPAVMLQALSRPADTETLLNTIFRETTTLGVRLCPVERRKLPRVMHEVMTSIGKVRIKVSRLGGEIRDLAPEYEDCKRLAREHDVPLREVFELARQAALDQLKF
jgi:hypothetical protein